MNHDVEILPLNVKARANPAVDNAEQMEHNTKIREIESQIKEVCVVYTREQALKKLFLCLAAVKMRKACSRQEGHRRLPQQKCDDHLKRRSLYQFYYAGCSNK